MRKQSYLTKIRRYRMKTEAIRLKGGKCIKCEWTGNIAAFQFHHRDPTKKDFTISQSPKVSWEKYWNEIEKCDLLCANCHATIHADNTNPTFLQDVMDYAGRTLISSNVPWKNQTHIPTKYSRKCPVCKSDFDTSRREQQMCSKKCQNENRQKCVRPSKKELEKMILDIPMTRIADKYGVTDNAIRKWCKSYRLI